MFRGIIDFMEKVAALKRTERSGWVNWVGVDDPESVADHSFNSTVLAMCSADLKGLNSEKLMRMLLLHDIHESITGDYDHFAKKGMSCTELKNRKIEAVKRVLEELPERLREKYFSIWLEYEEQKSFEAKIARQIDQLEMILQALEYEKKGYSEEKLNVFWGNVEEKLEFETLRSIFKCLKIKRSRFRNKRSGKQTQSPN